MKMLEYLTQISPVSEGAIKLINPCRISLDDMMSRKNDVRETYSFTKKFRTTECEDGYLRIEEMLNYNSGSAFLRYFFSPKKGFEKNHSLLGVNFGAPSSYSNMMGKPASIKY